MISKRIYIYVTYINHLLKGNLKHTLNGNKDNTCGSKGKLILVWDSQKLPEHQIYQEPKPFPT